MAQFISDYTEKHLKRYKRIAETYHKYWTQFDLDLIRYVCEYPVIYQKSGDLNRYERALEIKNAWRDIAVKLEDIEIDVDSIKTRWKSIRDSYVKIRRRGGQHSCGESKYLDGTLSFLDKELELYEDDKVANMSRVPQIKSQYRKKTVDVETERQSLMDVTDNSDIRQLIHEEIDINDDGFIKVEEEKYNDDDNYINSLEEAIQLPGNENDDTETESQSKWDEEELLNATHLTQEMIQQLIYIKTIRYYSEPAKTSY